MRDTNPHNPIPHFAAHVIASGATCPDYFGKQSPHAFKMQHHKNSSSSRRRGPQHPRVQHLNSVNSLIQKILIQTIHQNAASQNPNSAASARSKPQFCKFFNSENSDSDNSAKCNSQKHRSADSAPPPRHPEKPVPPKREIFLQKKTNISVSLCKINCQPGVD